MRPTPSQEPALLDESRITITGTHITASGKSFKWRNTCIVRIDRKGNLLFTRIIRGATRHAAQAPF